MRLFSSFLQAALVTALLCPSRQVFAAPSERISPERYSARTLDIRDSGQSPINGLPACNTRAGDPTYAVGKSRWTDGEGTLLSSDCNSKQKGDLHCWTDYFIIGTDSAFDNWYEAVGEINCPTNGTCSEALGQLNQSCTSFSFSVSDSVKATFDVLFFKVEESITITFGQTWSTCNTKSTTETCMWSKGCHSIWASQEVENVHGYMRRSCGSPILKGGNMNNSSQRADGYFTRGMLDFVIPVAKGNEIFCDGTCDDDFYPGPVPQANSTLIPYTSYISPSAAATFAAIAAPPRANS